LSGTRSLRQEAAFELSGVGRSVDKVIRYRHAS
jgi:hypothetical protein